MHKLKKIIRLSIIVFIMAAIAISVYGLNEDIAPADVAVVLGNQVYQDGTPAPRTAARLDRAFELYGEGLCKKIIVSGAVGKSGFDEATGMATYLKGKGVPEADIVVDSSGANSRATAIFTAAYLEEHKLNRAIVVSQYFHIARSELAFRQEGVDDTGATYARFMEWRDIFSSLREVPAIFMYWLEAK